MINHLVRRAVQAGFEHLTREQRLEKEANAFAELDYEFPTWGIAMMVVTTLAIVALASSVEYTVRMLIVNLAIVESPTSATVSIYKPVGSDDPDAPLEKRDPYAEIEVEKATVFSRPLTSSIRRSIMHLRSIGGWRARWRGIRVFAVYSAMVGLVSLFASLIPGVGPLISSFVGALVGARWHCAWTHATISMPSEKKPFERLPLRNAWRQLAGPTLLKTAAVNATFLLTLGQIVWSFNQVSDLIDAKDTAGLPYMFWLAAPVVVAGGMFVFAVVPAYVVLVRKEASLLPEEEDTIVPVDRTFGGRVCESTGFLSAKDAWKGFTNEAWVRVTKLHLKFAVICLGLTAFLVQLLLLQVWFIMGDNLDVLIDSGIARLATLGIEL